MSKYDDIGVDRFREAMAKSGGNLSKAAAMLGIGRSYLNQYCKKNEEWGNVVRDSRKGFLDECMASARVLALGIPERDEKGQFVGWIEKPDGYMLRYLISKLGRDEGFGEEQVAEQESDETITTINLNCVFNDASHLEMQKQKKDNDETDVNE